MDSPRALRLEPDELDRYWQGYRGRDCLERPAYTYSERFLDLIGYYEEVGDDLGRHERMAEAMYDI